MNQENDNKINDPGSPDSENDYAFLRETVKQKPLTARDIMYRLLAIAASAVLFGSVAGLTFRAVSNVSGTPAQTVSIPRDDSSEGEPSDTSPAEGTDSSGESDSVPAETPVPSPTPSLTPEEKNALAIEADRQFYTAMRSVADRVKCSVVTVTGLLSQEDWFHQETVVSRTVSGVIAADNGQSLLILVESRVLDGSERIAVTFHDNTIADASFLKSDPSVGLTVLSVLREGLPEQLQRTAVPAELGNSYSLLLGDALIALGSPTGNAGSFACGHVTSLETPVSLVDGSFPLITTDIEGTSAGSGVLYNTDGKVVGFIAQQYAPTGTGIITAIPISLMKSTIELLSNGSPIPYLGIRGQDISVSVSEKTGLPKGIYVTEALADSPAFAAGVQPGDIITVIDDKNVLTLRALHERLMDFVPGTEVSLTVLRNGAEGYVEIPLTVQIGELS